MAEGNEKKKKRGAPQQEASNGNHQDDETVSETSSVTSSSFIKDCEQKMSEEANREVRERYRNLLQVVQEKADCAGGSGLDITNIQTMVDEANSAFTSVQRPREAVMDAQFLKTCGLLAKLNIESAQSNLTVFRPAEYAKKMIYFMNPDGESRRDENQVKEYLWRRFGSAVASLYKRSHGLEPMVSALEFEKPKPVRKQRVIEKDREIQKKIPTAVVQAVNGEERQTEEVSRLFRILNRKYQESRKQPVCFFSFVVNPNSYSQTAENLFHTSFLVREQLAIVEEDENGFPVISPREQSVAPVVGGISSQCIISISKEEWRDIVKTFRITEPMIPSHAERGSKRSLM